MKNYNTILIEILTDDVFEGRKKMFISKTFKIVLSTKKISNLKRTLYSLNFYINSLGFDKK